ncbi:hypothetical protein SDC9_184209 [bioreactor metagenome]|uniref:Uncharacterized protein n=1 Tax=bioreactor metagenome TaxID=1076179 RepID=A0A645HEY1_9ZZZZ
MKWNMLFVVQFCIVRQVIHVQGTKHHRVPGANLRFRFFQCLLKRGVGIVSVLKTHDRGQKLVHLLRAPIPKGNHAL